LFINLYLFLLQIQTWSSFMELQIVSPVTKVMRLAVPTTLHHHQQQQTHHIVTTTQGGGTGTAVVTVTTTTANQSAPVAASHIISGIIKRSGTATREQQQQAKTLTVKTVQALPVQTTLPEAPEIITVVV
jgi:hypothetical protein